MKGLEEYDSGTAYVHSIFGLRRLYWITSTEKTCRRRKIYCFVELVVQGRNGKERY